MFDMCDSLMMDIFQVKCKWGSPRKQNSHKTNFQSHPLTWTFVLFEINLQISECITNLQSHTFPEPKIALKINGWKMKSPAYFQGFMVSFREGYGYMDVSENNGTPKSSILIGFSILNHPFWGTPIFGNTHMVIPTKNSPPSPSIGKTPVTSPGGHQFG